MHQATYLWGRFLDVPKIVRQLNSTLSLALTGKLREERKNMALSIWGRVASYKILGKREKEGSLIIIPKPGQNFSSMVV